MPTEYLVRGKRVVIRKVFDVVSIEYHCGDEYEAATLVDEIHDRLRSGDKIILSVGKKMKNDTILKLIPLLSKEDLKTVKALVEKRLAGEKVEDEAVKIVVKLLNEQLGCTFTALRPEWAKNARGLVEFVDELFPEATKVQRVALIKLCLGLVIDDLKTRMSVVRPGAVLINLVRVREVFDNAFPDYLVSGLVNVILKRMVKRDDT